MAAFTPMKVRSMAHGQSAASGCGQRTWLFGNSFTHLTITGRPRFAPMLIEGQVAMYVFCDQGLGVGARATPSVPPMLIWPTPQIGVSRGAPVGILFPA